MLKPEDIKYINLIVVDATQEQECELQFDEAIRKAAESGEWPAIVPKYRDGISPSTIARVALKYQNVGWIVTIIPGHYRALISKPDNAQ